MKSVATDQTDLYAHSSSICLLSSHLLHSTLVEKALTLIMDLSSVLLIQSLCVSVCVCVCLVLVFIKGYFCVIRSPFIPSCSGYMISKKAYKDNSLECNNTRTYICIYM